jgi:hypothetical protein
VDVDGRDTYDARALANHRVVRVCRDAADVVRRQLVAQRLTRSVIARLVAVVLFASVAVGAFTGLAGAANKTLWHMVNLDAAASEIAGFPLAVVASDNVYEWNILTGGESPYNVTGFNLTFATPSTLLYDPADGKYYSAYRVIFLSPYIYAVLHTDLTHDNPYDVAITLLTLDHEAQHQRLHSGDEGRVNACALADMSRFAAKFVPPTVQQTVQVPVTYTVTVRYRVRIKLRGGWVYRWRNKYVTRVRYEDQLQTLDNPAFVAILAAARDVYSKQPAPYSTGTCY